MKQSNLNIISRNSVLSLVNIRLFGIIALLVLATSVSTAFESAYADEDDPIKIVLDLTYQNILESREATGVIPDNADTFFLAGEEKYEEALAALEAGDIDSARDHALIAMALFEDSTQEIGAITEQISPFTPGFDDGVDVVIPSGAIPQFTSANIFDVQEEITGIDDEVDGLRELIESNGFDVNFEQYEDHLGAVKEALANGDISDAHAKIDAINEIKDDLYEQINESVEEQQDERVEQFAENSIKDIESILEKGENLGLTKKVIDELQDTLDVLKSGDIDDIIEKTSDDSEFAKEVKGNDEISNEFDDDGPGNSENAPGQNDDGSGNSENAPGQNDDGSGNSENAPGQNDDGSGNSENAPGQSDDGSGNSENAPGQNRGNDEAELPPGFDSASDTGKENGNGKGLGNIPPGQLKKLDYSEFGTYSPDDYFEDATEDLREDTVEEKYDKMNKDSKAKEKKIKENNERLLKEKGNTGGGNPNCTNEGITDGDSGNTSGQVGVDYTVQGFTAIGSNCKDATSKIRLTIDGPSSPPAKFPNESQPFTFQPDEAGTWIIQASAVGQFGTRTVTVAPPSGFPTANAGPNQNPVTENDLVILDGTGSSDVPPGVIVTYLWEFISPGQSPTLNSTSTAAVEFTAPDPGGNPSGKEYEFRLTVTDDDTNQNSDTVIITIFR